jgi:hypothetical protein
MENILATPGSAPALALDPSRIPPDDLRIALANALRDPDGQVYPWRDGYPLVGATVVYGDQLWTVAGKEPGLGTGLSTMVRIDGQGHDGRALAVRYELRPVTWSALDEMEYEVTLRAAIEQSAEVA